MLSRRVGRPDTCTLDTESSPSEFATNTDAPRSYERTSSAAPIDLAMIPDWTDETYERSPIQSRAGLVRMLVCSSRSSRVPRLCQGAAQDAAHPLQPPTARFVARTSVFVLPIEPWRPPFASGRSSCSSRRACRSRCKLALRWEGGLDRGFAT